MVFLVISTQEQLEKVSQEIKVRKRRSLLKKNAVKENKVPHVSKGH